MKHIITMNNNERKPMKNHQTNDEFMHYLMTSGSCPTGALSQCFIIDAIIKHADRVVDNADECREKMKNSFIHPEGWIKTAEWIKRELDQRNQRNTNER